MKLIFVRVDLRKHQIEKEDYVDFSNQPKLLCFCLNSLSNIAINTKDIQGITPGVLVKDFKGLKHISDCLKYENISETKNERQQKQE